ncbi:MAG: transporter substrate-binding domain-containing protein [Sphingobacteriia bacterium]|nr:transporter substrate-binding domain-containing protein [Sphingobacteriia bacterium]
MLKIKLLLIVIIFIFIKSSSAKAEEKRIIIRVGGYEFPPYLEKSSTQYTGYTIDLINNLNELQNKYYFKLVLTSSVRRYTDIKNNKFDLMFYENENWGWQKIQNITFSKSFNKDKEVFVTLANNETLKKCDIKGKKILGYLGYHYSFANFNSDPENLRYRYNTHLTTSHKNNLLSLINKSADYAVVNAQYLKNFITNNNSYKKQLYTCPTPDQEYEQKVLASNISPITLDEIIELINKVNSKISSSNKN